MLNKNEVDKRIGKNIQRIRKEQGLTQDEVAQRLGTIKQTVSKIERGTYSSTAKVIFDICEAINASPNELFYADTERLFWKEEDVNKTEYSMTGLSQTINTMEELWAKAEFYRNRSDDKMELAYLDQIIQVCLQKGNQNSYYRKFADFLYRQMLNDYLDKSTSEVRRNKVNNLLLSGTE